jgi:hypothetical protein
MGRKRKLPPPTCVYCGINPATTKEHVVPKCLFPRPLPPDAVILPVCEVCNKDKSQDDGYLRDILVMDYDGSESPIAQDIFHSKVMRSAQRNSSDAVRAAMTRARLIPHFSPSGLYLGQLPSFDIDARRINRIFSYIIRGLYYKTVGKRLPDDCSIDVMRTGAKDADDVLHLIKGLGCNGPYKIGSGVFACAFMYATEEPAISFWVLAFYQRVFFIVETTPLGADHGTLGS